MVVLYHHTGAFHTFLAAGKALGARANLQDNDRTAWRAISGSNLAVPATPDRQFLAFSAGFRVCTSASGAGEELSALIFEGMQRRNDSVLTWEVTRDGSQN